MKIVKNQVHEAKITSVTNEGYGVCKLDGFTVFVPYTVDGDFVRIKIVNVKKNYAYAIVDKLLEASSYRVEPLCKAYKRCGGCNFMHIDYEKQLSLKQQFVIDALKRIGGFENIKVEKTIGMKEPFHYRNKVIFPVGRNKNGDIISGFYRENSHDIVPLDECYISDKSDILIVNAVKEYMRKFDISPYDEQKNDGIIRRVFIRRSKSNGSTMVVISANANNLKSSNALVSRLINVCQNLKSVILNVNTKRNNRTLGDRNITLWGCDTISDTLCGVKFEISPESFYQINPIQAEVLYNKALEFACLDSTKTVLDLYCGIGTISLCAAIYSKDVIGVEIVEQAIINARKNALENNITNAQFYACSSNEILPKMLLDGAKPNVVILDPPRKGSDEETLMVISKMSPERIVYVSCNPATLARDLKFLCHNGYCVAKVVPVDMFGQTGHVECVVMIERK